MRLGFVLITHSNPGQVMHLTQFLKSAFPDCCIACHHDFYKEPALEKSDFTGVTFVEDYESTLWGHSSIIFGAIKAFRLLCGLRDPPEWFYLLSGADFPARPSRKIVGALRDSSYDVFIDHKIVPTGHTDSHYLQVCQYRYFSEDHPQFPCGFRCFAGEQWFTANLKAVRFLIDKTENEPRLIDHYRNLEESRLTNLDESYYQTVFCNAPGLNVHNHSLRYIDWSGRGAHPKTLTLRDLPRILTSGAHFARKLDPTHSAGLYRALGAIVKGTLR